MFSAHLRIELDTPHDDVLQNAYKMLREDFGFFFATLQIETQCLDESGADLIDLSSTAMAGGYENGH